MQRWIWNLFYLGRAPWDMDGPRPEIVRRVESGKLAPCRAIDLGCGTGDNVIYLAQQGFDVTGVDISSRAIGKARCKAGEARLSPAFLVADVTDLHQVQGPFGLVVDNGCLHSLLGKGRRQAYVRTLIRLTQPGSWYFLRCFVRGARRRFAFGLMAGEAPRLFGEAFEIEDFASNPGEAPWGLADATEVYWMRRKPKGQTSDEEDV
ncbi:MAG: class I SAM-dependent methyltransferase [Dehalococcoidia bacterium]